MQIILANEMVKFRHLIPLITKLTRIILDRSQINVFQQYLYFLHKENSK